MQVHFHFRLLCKTKPLGCIQFIFRLIFGSFCLSLVIFKFFFFVRDTKHLCVTFDLSETSSKSFLERMRLFPWQKYRNAVNACNISSIQDYTELLLETILIPFTIKEPTIPVNLSCQAPPILEPDKVGVCTKLKFARKVGVILNFGFDVDALELHLHELDSVADKLFLMEGTKMHNRYLDSKPSIWDMVKCTPRFSKFRDKVVHFILDEESYTNTESNGNIAPLPGWWDREKLQKQIRLEKFIEWNKATNYFGPQDIIGIGDTDEIPNRNVVNFLKSCELQSETVKIGIWFPFPYTDTIFSSDNPIHGYPYTFAAPVYSTINVLTNSFTESTVRAGISHDRAILGGVHFSKYPYLPFQLLKLLSCTTCGLDGIMRIIDIGLIYESSNNSNYESLDDLVTKMWMKKWDELSTRIQSVDSFKMEHGVDKSEMIIKLPWFYDCNPDRYPSFQRKRDQRTT